MTQSELDIVVIDHIAIIKSMDAQDWARTERANENLVKFFKDLREMEEKTYTRMVIVEKYKSDEMKLKMI